MYCSDSSLVSSSADDSDDSGAETPPPSKLPSSNYKNLPEVVVSNEAEASKPNEQLASGTMEHDNSWDRYVLMECS